MMLGYGFTFNNRHSSEFRIVARSDDRSLLPERRRNEYVVPGRDGALDYGGDNHEKRIVTVSIAIAARSLEELRQSARAAAHWLSGEGLLVFDDEPDKGYQAKVYQPLPLSLLASCGEAQVPFECRPFAESRYYRQLNDSFANKPHNTVINALGTRKTPCIIIIKNIGTTDISNIKLVRRAEA
jgi:predicted phage tail component-like protein